MQSEKWQTKLKQMIPSYGKSLAKDRELCYETRKWTSQTLHLNYIGPKQKL